MALARGALEEVVGVVRSSRLEDEMVAYEGTRDDAGGR